MGNEEAHQAVWDSVVAEREGGAAVEPPIEPVALEPAAPEPEKAAPPTTNEQLTQALIRIEGLEKQSRNLAGHIGGLTHQQKLLQETSQAANLAAKQVSDAPTKAQVNEAITNPVEWDRLKEDFPEWGVATEKFMDSRLANLRASGDSKQVERLVSEQVAASAAKITAEVRKEIVDSSLEAVFPGWKDRVQSAEFKPWLEQQTAEVKAYADSSEVGHAAKLLRLFEDAGKNSESQKLIDSRRQKLIAATAAPRGSRPVPNKSWDDMTAEEQWNYEARARVRARAT